MDSGNSGNLQSSSGGDEEYDSRASVAFNPPPPLSFDPFANYLQTPMLNFNVPWPGTNTPGSDPNPTTHRTSFVPRPAAAREAENNNFNESRLQQQSTLQNQAASARNPKKRSRASRRAPTTVLTTDTSNFRAMVQEFTGIPAPPFDNNININKSSRLDLFGTRSSTSFDGGAYPPPYLLLPFAQKPTPPTPFRGSNVNTAAASSTVNNNSSLVSTSVSSIDCSNTEAGNSSSYLFNIIQNPIIVNSLFQNNPSFPKANSSNFLFNSKPDQSFGNMIPSNEVHNYSSLHKMGGELSDQFGLVSHGNDHITLSGLPNLISSDQKDADQNEAAPDNNNYKFSVNNTNGVDGEPVNSNILRRR